MQGKSMQGVMWWATLVIAVLAVPSVGVVVAMMFPFGDLTQVIIFVLTCWVSTWLGMKLMLKSCMPRGDDKPQS